METHNVPSLAAPVRLQDYGVGLFMGALTKSAWKKALKQKRVRCNSALGATGDWVRGGETIVLTPPKVTTKPYELSLECLYEDDYLAVVNKPAGILVSGNRHKTLKNALTLNLSPSSMPDATVPQPVHRLDFPTTGLVLIGKTASAIHQLGQLFEQRDIQKRYLAIVIGSFPDEGYLKDTIAGKDAASTYRVLDRVPSKHYGSLSLLELRPTTGRRHQLRIQLSARDHPILGDTHYGGQKAGFMGKGLYLHAVGLSFRHPLDGSALALASPIPNKFLKLFHGTRKLL